MNHHWIKVLSIPLLSAMLVACPVDKITGIDASATPATIASAATSSLTATVSGTGTFNTAVSWSIVSGGGSLSANTGGSVTYTAPTVTATTPVQIKATAAGDSSVSKTVQVVVTPSTAPSGTLALNITGPTGTASFAPNVSVTGLGAPIVTLGSQNLTLPVGNVTVTANPVTKIGAFVDKLSQGFIDIAGKPTSSTLSIAQGTVTNVSVGYNAGFTGQLWKADNRGQLFGYDDSILTGGSSSVIPVGAGANYRDMAFDKSGNVWITDQNNTIQEYSPSFQLIQTISSTSPELSNPVGIAFDPSGNLWVSNFSNHIIVKYNQGIISGGIGTRTVSVSAIINVPSAFFYQIAFDKAGNLWAIDYREQSNSKLYRFKAADLNSYPQPELIYTDLTTKVYGISFDDAGNMWIAGSAGVYKYNPSDPAFAGFPTLLLTLNRVGNFNTATATAFDKVGNLWVCDYNGIYQFSAAQIATSSPSLTIEPAKSITVDHFVQAIRFYPIPANSPLYH